MPSPDVHFWWEGWWAHRGTGLPEAAEVGRSAALVKSCLCSVLNYTKFSRSLYNDAHAAQPCA